MPLPARPGRRPLHRRARSSRGAGWGCACGRLHPGRRCRCGLDATDAEGTRVASTRAKAMACSSRLATTPTKSCLISSYTSLRRCRTDDSSAACRVALTMAPWITLVSAMGTGTRDDSRMGRATRSWSMPGTLASWTWGEGAEHLGRDVLATDRPANYGEGARVLSLGRAATLAVMGFSPIRAGAPPSCSANLGRGSRWRSPRAGRGRAQPRGRQLEQPLPGRRSRLPCSPIHLSLLTPWSSLMAVGGQLLGGGQDRARPGGEGTG